MKSWLRFAYLIPIAIVYLLSFREFSPMTAPSINSDRAIHILMAYDFRVPEDLYYWGQDRLGSLVPMLGHGLVNVGIAPVTAIAIVQYGLLAVGLVCLASLLKSPLHQLILAIAWLLPSLAFKALTATAQPYGPQFAMIGVAILSAQQMMRHVRPVGHWRRVGWLVLLTIASITGVWLSELSIVPLGLLFLILGFDYWQMIRANQVAGNPLSWGRLGSEWATLGTTGALGVAFLLWAKANADGISRGLAQTLSWGERLEVATSLMTSLGNTLRFNNLQYVGYSQLRNIAHSIGAWLALLLLGYALARGGWFLWRRFRQAASGEPGTGLLAWMSGEWRFIWQKLWHGEVQIPLQTQWLLLFAMSTVVSLGLLVSSRWVYENNINLRYFAFVYLCAWMTALLLAEQVQWQTRWFSMSLLTIALGFALSQPGTVYALQPQPSHLSRLSALEELGQAGFIGDYWHSYHLCVRNPAMHKCSARQQGERQGEDWPTVRCDRCVEDVIDSPVIYLVKNGWLREFPDQIQQFDHTLQKIGDPIQIINYRLAPYRVVGSEE
jgi:hypothetical protein